MRIVVAAHHTWGVMCLERLREMGIEPDLVVTPPDDFDLDPGPYHHTWYESVADYARVNEMNLCLSASMSSADVEQAVIACRPDLIVNVAYGGIYRSPVLETPRFGILNFHGSLLPKHRGVTPITHTLAAGDARAGVSAHLIEAKIDTGPILMQRSVALASSDHAWEVFEKTWHLYPDMLEALIRRGPQRWQTTPQPPGGSYHGRRNRSQEAIDWNRPAEHVRNFIRGHSYPFRGAHTLVSGRPLVVWRVDEAHEDAQEMVPGTGRIVDDGRLVVACGQGAIPVSYVTYDGHSGRPGELFGPRGTFRCLDSSSVDLQRSSLTRW